MSASSEPSPKLGARSVLLAAPLCAAFANVAASVLDGPRAFASPAALALPLAVSVAGFVVLFLPVAALGLALRRHPSAPAPQVALAVLFVAAAALAVPLRALFRGLQANHAPIVWTLVLAFLGLLGCASFLAVARWRAGFAARARGLALASVVGSFLLLVVLWWSSFGSSGAAGAREAPPTGALADGLPPCVVLISVDTLRPDFLSGRQPLGVPTPAIDALLADSVVLENARSAAPWTKPSVATLLTGLSPLVHGTTSKRVRLPEEVDTLAEHLARRGYRTAGVGFNVHLEPAFRFDQGFGDYRFPARADYGSSLGAQLLRWMDPDRWPELFPSTTAIGDEALAWIDDHPDGGFFLWMHVLDPHWPYAPPRAHVSSAPPRGMGYFWGDPDAVTAVQAGRAHLGEESREWVRELYRGEIRYVDATVGRVLDGLRAHGLYDDALIVFASDHGEEFWEHGGYEHGHTLFDEVLRVPLAFKLPGAAWRGTRARPVSTESVVPTVLDLLGEVDAARFSAPSLAPLLRGEDVPLPPLVATGTFYFGEKLSVLFDARWKLVVELDTGREALYDLEADPRELHSLAAVEPALVERGRALVRERVEAGARLRAALGLSDANAEVDESALKLLESLGYAGGD